MKKLGLHPFAVLESRRRVSGVKQSVGFFLGEDFERPKG